MIPFNFHHLYYFYITAKHGSVSKAAKELRIAQPTLSTQLKQFESYFEIKLFEKEGRNIVVTEKGQQILNYAKAIFDLGEELSYGLSHGMIQGKQKVQIGVSSFIPKSFVDYFLKYIYKFFPGIYVRVVEKEYGELIQELKSYQLDMVINDLPHPISPEGEFHNHQLAKIPIVFCGTASWARKIKRIPGDLNRMPIFIPTSQSQTYVTLQEYFLTHKIKPRVCGEIQDVELVRRLVLAGMGIAPLNKFTVIHAPEHEKIKILNPQKNLQIYDTIYLVTKQRKAQHPVVDYILKDFHLNIK